MVLAGVLAALALERFHRRPSRARRRPNWAHTVTHHRRTVADTRSIQRGANQCVAEVRRLGQSTGGPPPAPPVHSGARSVSTSGSCPVRICRRDAAPGIAPGR